MTDSALPRVMKSPRSVDIEITGRCNLRCLYCSYFTGSGQATDLPAEEWLSFFEELTGIGVMNVTLSGGEPFLREDILQIIDGIVRNRMRFSVLSNGTLVTPEIAKHLRETRRCDAVQISVDGADAPTHEVCRGEGSFGLALAGIRLLQEYEVPVTVRVTLHHYNVRSLDGIAKLLLDDLGLSSFSTNSASSVGLCNRNARVQLTVEDREIAMKTLVRLNEEYGGRISAVAGPLAEAYMWGEMEKARREGLAELPGRGRLTACNCPRQRISVRADGVIVPCSYLSHIELGRINRDRLATIWQTHPEMARLRNRLSIPLAGFDFCRGCDYVNYCTGNCPAMAYSLLGVVDHPSPDACLHRYLKAGGSLPDLGGNSDE